MNKKQIAQKAGNQILHGIITLADNGDNGLYDVNIPPRRFSFKNVPVINKNMKFSVGDNVLFGFLNSDGQKPFILGFSGFQSSKYIHADSVACWNQFQGNMRRNGKTTGNINTYTGTVKWTVELDNDGNSPVIAVKENSNKAESDTEIIIFIDGDKTYGYNTATGAKLWEYERTAEPAKSVFLTDFQSFHFQYIGRHGMAMNWENHHIKRIWSENGLGRVHDQGSVVLGSIPERVNGAWFSGSITAYGYWDKGVWVDCGYDALWDSGSGTWWALVLDNWFEIDNEDVQFNYHDASPTITDEQISQIVWPNTIAAEEAKIGGKWNYLGDTSISCGLTVTYSTEYSSVKEIIDSSDIVSYDGNIYKAYLRKKTITRGTTSREYPYLMHPTSGSFVLVHSADAPVSVVSEIELIINKIDAGTGSVSEFSTILIPEFMYRGGINNASDYSTTYTVAIPIYLMQTGNKYYNSLTSFSLGNLLINENGKIYVSASFDLARLGAEADSGNASIIMEFDTKTDSFKTIYEEDDDSLKENLWMPATDSIALSPYNDTAQGFFAFESSVIRWNLGIGIDFTKFTSATYKNSLTGEEIIFIFAGSGTSKTMYSLNSAGRLRWSYTFPDFLCGQMAVYEATYKHIKYPVIVGVTSDGHLWSLPDQNEPNSDNFLNWFVKTNKRLNITYSIVLDNINNIFIFHGSGVTMYSDKGVFVKDISGIIGYGANGRDNLYCVGGRNLSCIE
jgi:hypothetical protein